MDPIAVQFHSFLIDIVKAKTYDEIIAVLRAIDAMDPALFEKHREKETYYQLNPQALNLTKALTDIFRSTKDLSLQMKVMKAIMKPALCMNYFYVELAFDWYTANVSALGAECLRVYAWLQNHKHIETVNVYLPNNLRVQECYEDCSLKYSPDTRYFALSIENMITASDMSFSPSFHSFSFTIILTNLENSHKNVHKLLLELYKRFVIHYKADNRESHTLIDKVIELPWTSRNKYPLLAHLIAEKEEILLKSPNFSMTNFMGGLQIGLTLHHLLAPSQTLCKVLRGKKVFLRPLLGMMAEILWNGDVIIAANLIKFWFSTLRGKEVEQLFKIMNSDGKFLNIPTTSEKFYRLLLLRNAFKKTFIVPKFDEQINEFACSIDDMPTKIEIFHILMDNIQATSEYGPRLESVLLALKFIRYNIAIDDSSFIDQHIVRKLPDFFNLLASKKMSDVNVLREIFKIIRDDIYQQGFEINSYESTMFSLKLLNVILKQYFGSSGTRLSRSTNIEGNLSFGKYLKENDIWDVTSSVVFNQLIKLMENNENGDISETVMRILVEYFVKKTLVDDFMVDGEKFCCWITEKVGRIIDGNFIPASTSADRHFILKFEYLLTRNSFNEELELMIERLKEGFVKLKDEDNPVDSMEKGIHLYRVIDCINYGLKRLEPSQVKLQLIPALSILLKIITSYFLNFMSDENVPPSFEILDQKLTSILAKSTILDDESQSIKPKLVLYLWYTLRATSEIMETLVSIAKSGMNAGSKDYRQVMNTSVCLLIQILSRCCHKGVIDSASQALGRITKVISEDFMKLYPKTTAPGRNLHSLLVILKGEIDCGTRESGDIRSTRGLLVMSHKIIHSHPPFLKFLMEKLLVTVKVKRFEDTLLIRFCDNIKPIQLHLLAALIRDGDLVENMLQYYDSILLATFKAYKGPKDFVVENALLQICGAVIPKLANQKRHMMGEDDDDATIRYEPKAVTAYEFYVKATYAFRVALFDFTRSDSRLPTAYVIVLLEIFSNFEYRYPGENWSEIEEMRKVFRRLMSHESEKVRLLAAKCFAQWHDNNDRMLKIIKEDVDFLFSSDGNVITSTAYCLNLMIQRYESNTKFVKSFDVDEFKSSLRSSISEKFATNAFIGANNFFIRYHLLIFLTFLGFTINDEVVQSLTYEKGLTSHFGYQMWLEKVKQLKK